MGAHIHTCSVLLLGVVRSLYSGQGSAVGVIMGLLIINIVSQVSSGTVVQARQLLEKMLRQCNAPLSEENKVLHRYMYMHMTCTCIHNIYM